MTKNTHLWLIYLCSVLIATLSIMLAVIEESYGMLFLGIPHGIAAILFGLSWLFNWKLNKIF